MRTPLTSLRSNSELLRRIEALPVAERVEVVDDVLEDIDEMTALLEELVDLASDMTTAEPTEPLRLAAIAQAVANRALRRTGRLVDVVVEPPEVDVHGRPRQLERAVANLVDNAAKYSADGTPIMIRVTGAQVTVLDRGRGIPEADLGHVFDRFHRSVESRSEPGSGLGLSIVDEIVRSHDGSVFARSRAGGGAEVGFDLEPQRWSRP
jgi:two-component system, OmpR family, sensor histidine kinase MprB